MRLFLKILAVIAGLLCGLMAIGSGLVFARLVVACFQDHPTLRGPILLPFLMAFSAGFAWLGFLLAARAYGHLRHPDRRTANNVAGIATFLLASSLLNQLTKNSLGPTPGVRLGPGAELGVLLAVVIAAYLFYRLVLKRVAALAFPIEETSGDEPIAQP
jgi:hypothetical protein